MEWLTFLFGIRPNFGQTFYNKGFIIDVLSYRLILSNDDQIMIAFAGSRHKRGSEKAATSKEGANASAKTKTGPVKEIHPRRSSSSNVAQVWSVVIVSNWSQHIFLLKKKTSKD